MELIVELALVNTFTMYTNMDVAWAVAVYTYMVGIYKLKGRGKIPSSFCDFIQLMQLHVCYM